MLIKEKKRKLYAYKRKKRKLYAYILKKKMKLICLYAKENEEKTIY